MEKWLHIEIDVICISILLQLINSLGRQDEGISEYKIFKYIVYILMGIHLNDIIWFVLEIKSWSTVYVIKILSIVIYFVLSGLVAFMWLIYTDYRLFQKWERIYKLGKWYAIPVSILIGISIVSIWTKWLYDVDIYNKYYRGSAYWIFIVIILGYLIYASMLAYSQSRSTVNTYEKHEQRILVYFSILPVIAGIIQIFAQGIPIMWPAIVILILMIFNNIQSKQIFTDSLTGINNRRQLNKYLGTQMLYRQGGDKLYLLLIDIDLFKRINDTYGHTEGDRALIYVADVLKQICYGKNDFLARYGGDEFAIVCKRKDKETIECLRRSIQEKIQELNESKKLKYNLSLSIGYAEYESESMENQLIVDADKMLYKIKAKQKIESV
ncbi:MAG: GGDEF domain-containing protein [Cellulosilyticum sp.]|nr:GGDEF domain-containing protein [Cellulosilyticum sp.]